MKMKDFTVCLVVMISLIASAVSAEELTGDQVMDKVDAVISAPSDSPGTGIMILVDKKGKEKERRLKMWTRHYKDKDDWSLTKFSEPAEVRNLGFLSLADDKMYLYLPAFDRVRRIASHARKESFAGSDLSNDDLSTGKYQEHYSAKILEETDQEYVLELIRKPGSNRIYPRTKAWVNKSNFTISKMEMMDENDKLWKTLEAKNEQIQGYWTMAEITMTDVRKDHKTIMKMEDLKFDVGLEDSMFTQRYLKRRLKSE